MRRPLPLSGGGVGTQGALMLCHSGLYPGAVIQVPDACAAIVVVVVDVVRAGPLVVVRCACAAASAESAGAVVEGSVVLGAWEEPGGTVVVVVERSFGAGTDEPVGGESVPGGCALASADGRKATAATTTAAARADLRSVHHRISPA